MGEAGQRRPGRAATGPRSHDPGWPVYVVHGPGPRDLLRLWEEERSWGLPSWLPSSSARLSAVRDLSGGAVGPQLLLRVFGGGEGGVLSLPHITALETTGRHPPPFRRQGCTKNDRGSGVPLRRGRREGLPAPYTWWRSVFLLYETLPFFLLCHLQTTPPSG